MRFPTCYIPHSLARPFLLALLCASTHASADANPLTACAACHGDHGQGNAAAGIPALAGLGRDYLQQQLHDYAAGRRTNAVMQPVARGLNAQQIVAAAKHYAALPPPHNPVPAKDNTHSRGAVIAEQGLWQQQVPACNQCHGPRGAGTGDRFPRLAGQPAAYLTAQLHAWQKHQRPPGPLGLMQAVADRLSNADIDAVSGWLAGNAVGPSPSGADSTEPPAPATAGFQSPRLSTIPQGPFGDMVRQGYRIFTNTPANARQYVGNQLSCTNCHLDSGRLANSAPLWAAFGAYPAYRQKNHRVNSFADRLQGCFRFSMNGKAPPADSEVILALESYSFWMAKGAPIGHSLPGRGYPSLATPKRPPDYANGKRVYEQHCALCHQADGQGLTVDGHTRFPPLWGSGSFNWGAGMGRVNTAAAFIRANMPLGLAGSLSEQQAWDVALFMDSQERPQDPRYTGSVAETRKRFHDTRWSMYGRVVNGHLLGYGNTDSQARPTKH